MQVYAPTCMFELRNWRSVQEYHKWLIVMVQRERTHEVDQGAAFNLWVVSIRVYTCNTTENPRGMQTQFSYLIDYDTATDFYEWWKWTEPVSSEVGIRGTEPKNDHSTSSNSCIFESHLIHEAGVRNCSRLFWLGNISFQCLDIKDNLVNFLLFGGHFGMRARKRWESLKGSKIKKDSCVTPNSPFIFHSQRQPIACAFFNAFVFVLVYGGVALRGIFKHLYSISVSISMLKKKMM